VPEIPINQSRKSRRFIEPPRVTRAR